MLDDNKQLQQVADVPVYVECDEQAALRVKKQDMLKTMGLGSRGFPGKYPAPETLDMAKKTLISGRFMVETTCIGDVRLVVNRGDGSMSGLTSAVVPITLHPGTNVVPDIILRTMHHAVPEAPFDPARDYRVSLDALAVLGFPGGTFSSEPAISGRVFKHSWELSADLPEKQALTWGITFDTGDFTCNTADLTLGNDLGLPVGTELDVRRLVKGRWETVTTGRVENDGKFHAIVPGPGYYAITGRYKPLVPKDGQPCHSEGYCTDGQCQNGECVYPGPPDASCPDDNNPATIQLCKQVPGQGNTCVYENKVDEAVPLEGSGVDFGRGTGIYFPESIFRGTWREYKDTQDYDHDGRTDEPLYTEDGSRISMCDPKKDEYCHKLLGVYSEWPRDVDRDRDGLEDRAEYLIARHFQPLYVLDDEEKATAINEPGRPQEPVVLFQVHPLPPCRPASQTPNPYCCPWDSDKVGPGEEPGLCIKIRYLALWRYDGGYGKCTDWFIEDTDNHPGDTVSSTVILQTPHPMLIHDYVRHLTHVHGPPTLLIPVAVDGWHHSEVNKNRTSGEWLAARRHVEDKDMLGVFSDIITCQDYATGRRIWDGGDLDGGFDSNIRESFDLPMRPDIAALCPKNGFNPVYYISSNKHHDYLRYDRDDGDVWPSWYTDYPSLCCDDVNARGPARFQDLTSCAHDWGDLHVVNNNVGEFDNFPGPNNKDKDNLDISLDQRGYEPPGNSTPQTNHDYHYFVNRLDDCGYLYDDAWDGMYEQDGETYTNVFLGGWLDCLGDSFEKCDWGIRSGLLANTQMEKEWEQWKKQQDQDEHLPCSQFEPPSLSKVVNRWLNNPDNYYNRTKKPPDSYYQWRACLITPWDTDSPVDKHFLRFRIGDIRFPRTPNGGSQ